MYRRMLVATGEHPWSSPTVDYSIALAAHTGAKLCFLRVLSLPLLACTPDSAPGCAMLADSLVAHSEDILSWVATAAEEAEVPYTTIRRWGRIPETIRRSAEEEDCDLIVVGARVCSGWQHPLRGAVAKKVARRARQPVLVVKQPPSHAADVACWSRVLVVTDGSPSANVALEYALALAQAEHLDVLLLHVKAAWLPGASRHAQVRTKDTGTLAAAQAVAAGVRYEAQVASGSDVAAIVQTAAHRQCDVILLGVHGGSPWQRLWRDTLLKAVTARAPFPVLLVPSLPGLLAAVGGENGN